MSRYTADQLLTLEVGLAFIALWLVQFGIMYAFVEYIIPYYKHLRLKRVHRVAYDGNCGKQCAFYCHI